MSFRSVTLPFFHTAFCLILCAQLAFAGNCNMEQFQCRVSGRCIPRDQVRNLRNNCGTNDTSDEEEPLTRCHSQSEFRCRGNGQCIPRHHVNRLIRLCANHTYDGQIPGFPCSSNTEFRCNGDRCILRRKVKDTIRSCHSSDDETLNNGLECDATREFRCTNGRCILRSQVLDGLKDCPNGDDEKAKAKLGSCLPSNGELRCQSGRCVLRSSLGEVEGCNSENGKQESTIKHCLSESEFRCSENENKSISNNITSAVRCIPRSWINDGKSQCEDGSDENVESIKCLANEWSCDGNTRCLSKYYLCDGIPDCRDCSDETDPTICAQTQRSRFFVCTKTNAQKHLGESFRSGSVTSSHCIYRSYFCDGFIDCADGSDERSFGEGFKCQIKSKAGDDLKTCLVPPSLINDGVKDCSDGSDEQTATEILTGMAYCLSRRLSPANRSSSGLIKLSQMCDGVFDCADLSDECLCNPWSEVARTEARTTCDMLLYHKPKGSPTAFLSTSTCQVGMIACNTGIPEKCIPTSAVCDGQSDCEFKTDEKACGRLSLPSASFKVPKIRSFKCPLDDSLLYLAETYSEIKTSAVPCDGVPECMGLYDECGDMSTCNNRTGKAPYCQHLIGQLVCNESQPNSSPLFPDKVCDGTVDCLNEIDELYCNHSRYYCDVISSTPSQRSGVITKRKVSIPLSKVCDGRVDCLGFMDERNCSDLFYCRDNVSPFFINVSQVLDGRKDCGDGSDECPNDKRFDHDYLSSRDHLVKYPVLRAWLWIMGLVALGGNLLVMLASAERVFFSSSRLVQRKCCTEVPQRGRGEEAGHQKKRHATPLAKCNDILVLNLAAADLLTGIYLLAIAIKSSQYYGSYCSHEISWRSSWQCLNLGILVTASFQASVGIMVILTSYRLYAVVQPWKVARASVPVAVGWTAVAWTLAVGCALLPTLVMFREGFVTSAVVAHGQGQLGAMFFDAETVDKRLLVVFLRKSCALARSALSSNASQVCDVFVEDVSWNAIHEAADVLHPGLLTGDHISYYSAHGVCLPNFFPRLSALSNTSHSSASGRTYTAILMILNFTAFLYIACAYAVVWFKSANPQKPKTNNGQPNNRNKNSSGDHKPSSRINKMHRKITKLIITDFLCWVPICILSFCGLSGLPIPAWAYPFTAAVLLPINSAINPILYSDVIQTSCSIVTDKIAFLVTGKEPARKGSFPNSSDRSMTFSQHKRLSIRPDQVNPPQAGLEEALNKRRKSSLRDRFNTLLTVKPVANDARRISKTQMSELDATHVRNALLTPAVVVDLDSPAKKTTTL